MGVHNRLVKVADNVREARNELREMLEEGELDRMEPDLVLKLGEHETELTEMCRTLKDYRRLRETWED